MKKVLVTGSTGFIGRHLIPELLNRGFSVISSSRNATTARNFKWFKHVRHIPFDFRTFSTSLDYYQYFEEPDFMIHLAWEGLPNYKDQFHIKENFPRHAAFIENLIAKGLNDISVIGTCFEYGLMEGKLSEDMSVNPKNAYGIAKNKLRLHIEKLGLAEHFSYKWIRLFYLYGEGQNPNSLFSQLQTALANKEDSFNMSPGDQLRDFLEVSMAAKYIVSIASQTEISGIINCCSGEPITVKDFVINYLRKINKSININQGFYAYSDIEPKHFWGDNSRLKKILHNERSDN